MGCRLAARETREILDAGCLRIFLGANACLRDGAVGRISEEGPYSNSGGEHYQLGPDAADL